MSRPRTGLWIAVLAYLGLRVLVLATNFDDVAITMYELHPMGTIPTILLEGGIDLSLRHFYDNAAGQIVTGLLATPLYALLGPTYLALKLVPMLLGLGALVLIWLFLGRWFDRRAADFGALLFALGPATMVKYSLTSSGNHFENLFFTLLATWAVWRVHAPGGNRVHRLWFAGWACGTALFVFLGSIPVVGLLLLAHLGVVGWRRCARDLTQALLPFLLGLLPLILLNLTTQARGGSFLAARFGRGTAGGIDAARVATRFVEFFTTKLLPAPTYPDLLGIPGEVANTLLVLLLGVAWLACLPGALRAVRALAAGALGRGLEPGRLELREAALAPFVLYYPLTALAYALTDLRIAPYAPPIHAGGYRYYMPTFLFACVLIAVVAARWTQTPRRRVAGRVLAGLALVTALFDFGLARPRLDRIDLGMRYEGHYIKQVSRTLLGRKQGLDLEQVVSIAESFPPVYRARIYEGLGFYRALEAALDLQGDVARIPLERVASHWPDERRPDAWRGAGTFLRTELTEPARRAAALSLLERWRAEDPRATAHVLEGLALDWETILVRQQEAHWEVTFQVLEVLPVEMHRDAVRGLGIDAGRVLRRDIPVEAPRTHGLWGRIPERTDQAFLEGLGVGLADGRRDAGWPQSTAVATGWDPTPLLAALRARVEQLHGSAASTQLEGFAALLPADWYPIWSRLGTGGGH